MNIIKLAPAFKEIIWGGQKLKQLYKNEGFGNIAEAWTLSCHKDGQSIIDGGEYDGLPLWDAIRKIGTHILGTNCKNKDEFPILIKLIDAEDRLSVQVHPDNDYARKYENDSGKTEAWYILDCAPGAELIYGFKETPTKEALRASISAGTLLESVNAVPVKPGDVAFIPSGTLHAIGAGILLAEVQQSSNTTYRVYDYNRKDKDGRTRALHVDKAAQVMHTAAQKADFSPKGRPEQHVGYTQTLLAECEYFKMRLLETETSCKKEADASSFVSLLVLEGEGALLCGGEQAELQKGGSFFIPAGAGAFELRGKLKILETRI